MHPFRDTILFVIGCLVLTGLAWLLIWDYVESRRKDGYTISKRMLALWKNRQNQPQFWLFLGVVIGLVFGFSLGFVLGHLFWPQAV